MHWKIFIIVSKWKAGDEGNKDAYMNVYRELKAHDDGIARRYNGLTGSGWFGCIAGLFAEDVLTEEDIAPLSEETKRAIYFIKDHKPKPRK